MSASQRDAGDLRTDPLLSARAKEAIRALLSPVVRLAIRLGLTPNAVTVIGFLVALVGALLVALGYLVPGAAVLTGGLLLDAVDGALARATNGGTAFGNFLDSTLDRAAEAGLYGGVIAYLLATSADATLGVTLAMAALVTSFLVSYTRAKAESLGLGASVGLAPRTERLVIIVVGIALAGLGWEIGLLGAMGLVAALAALTTAQRIWYVGRAAGGHRARETKHRG